MAPSFHHVALADIALSDLRFIVTYRPELQALQQAVARAGVLTPLHLRRQSAAAPLQIVCGWKRLLACQHIGLTVVPALIHDAAELTEAQALLLAIHENLGCRVLNAVETGRVLQRLRDVLHYPVEQLVTDWCAPLGVARRTETVQAYCDLAVLEEPLQAAVVHGHLPVETARWIASYGAPDRRALLALFTGVHMSSNRARECAVMIDDICHRDDCAPAGLLQQLGVPAILEEAQLSGPQKLERIRRALHEARYPLLSTHEQRFREALRRLRLPSQVRVQAPPYFEGDAYQVAFAFRSPQELQHYARCLLDAAADTALQELLSLL